MRWLVLALLAGCFEPQIPDGLRCSEERTCPPGQLCFGMQCATPQACDPVLQDCPPRGGTPQNCYLGELGEGQCFFRGSEAPVGTACDPMFINVCMQGTGCIDSVCRAFCDFARFPDQSADCGGGLVCRQAAGDIGVCR